MSGVILTVIVQYYKHDRMRNVIYNTNVELSGPTFGFNASYRPANLDLSRSYRHLVVCCKCICTCVVSTSISVHTLSCHAADPPLMHWAHCRLLTCRGLQGREPEPCVSSARQEPRWKASSLKVWRVFGGLGGGWEGGASDWRTVWRQQKPKSQTAGWSQVPARRSHSCCLLGHR